MANQFVFTDWVSTEALRLLINKLVVAGIFNTDWKKDFEQDFPVGDTVRIKLPQRFTIRDGLGYTPQPINRLNTTAAINIVKGVDFEYDDMEKMLKMERSLEEISEQYIEPAVAQIAQEIDSQAALFAYQWTNNFVGTLGVDPNAIAIFEQARQRLFELACPPSGEKMFCIPPAVNTAMVPALVSLLNPSSQIFQSSTRMAPWASLSALSSMNQCLSGGTQRVPRRLASRSMGQGSREALLQSRQQPETRSIRAISSRLLS